MARLTAGPHRVCNYIEGYFSGRVETELGRANRR